MRADERRHDLDECCEWPDERARSNVDRLLQNAQHAIDGEAGLRVWLNGTLQERAWLALHEAEWRELLVMDSEQLLARLPGLVTIAQGELGPDDGRVRAAQNLLYRSAHRRRHPDRLEFVRTRSSAHGLPMEPGTRFRLTRQERATVAAMVRDGHNLADEAYAASRGFRNRILVLMIVALSLLVMLLAAAAIWSWALTPTPDVQVNDGVATWSDQPAPRGGPAFTAVALLGAVGAFLSGIRSVARTGGTRNPFSLSWWQLWLKLPVGALTAVVGLFLLQSRAFPVVPATRWPDLLLWAVAFGAAQQAVTQLVDRRVQDVIGGTGSRDDSSTSAPKRTQPTTVRTGPDGSTDEPSSSAESSP